MANKRSALKAHRVSERRHERNRAVKSALRTFVKKARTEIEGSSEEANTSVALAAKELDAAASKGVIHRNQAARRKSRLMHHLAQMSSEAAAEKPATTTRGRARTATSKAKPAAGTRRTTRSTTSRTKK